ANKAQKIFGKIDQFLIEEAIANADSRETKQSRHTDTTYKILATTQPLYPQPLIWRGGGVKINLASGNLGEVIERCKAEQMDPQAIEAELQRLQIKRPFISSSLTIQSSDHQLEALYLQADNTLYLEDKLPPEQRKTVLI